MATFGELPRIRSTGAEVGPTPGFGSMIYGEDDLQNDGPGLPRETSWGKGVGNVGTGRDYGRSDDAHASAAKLRKDGKWLGELDVRHQLFAENPLLKR